MLSYMTLVSKNRHSKQEHLSKVPNGSIPKLVNAGGGGVLMVKFAVVGVVEELGKMVPPSDVAGIVDLLEGIMGISITE